MIQRLAKGVLPPNTQLSKDAVLAMQKGATVFVNHIAAAYDTPSASPNFLICPALCLRFQYLSTRLREYILL